MTKRPQAVAEGNRANCAAFVGLMCGLTTEQAAYAVGI
jgi:hypothetical protein